MVLKSRYRKRITESFLWASVGNWFPIRLKWSFRRHYGFLHKLVLRMHNILTEIILHLQEKVRELEVQNGNKK